MRRPRVEDYDTNAKLPELASSLDGMPVIGKPPQKIKDASPSHQSQTEEKQIAEGQKPANVQARKRAKLSAADFDKVEKYTTHLEPSLIKKIKLEAIEKDMKDYNIVRAALIQYFENNK